VLKLASDVQPHHELEHVDAVGNGVLNEVSPLDSHALLKFTVPVAAVPSFAPAGNDVRVETEFHAFEKSVPLLMSSAGKLVKRVS